MEKKNIYEKIEQIGRGSSGETYKVLNKEDNKNYAMKKIFIKGINQKDLEKIKNESEILSLINSEYIIKYFDSFSDEENFYIIMEYCENSDLSKFIINHKNNNNLLDKNTILFIILNICSGLKELHHQNIIHRDLKPGNIFISKDYTVKIADFSISKHLISETTNTNLGTIEYSAPEILEKKPYNKKVDIWALGCIIYELCTLKKCFEFDITYEKVTKFYENVGNGNFEKIDNIYHPELQNLLELLLKPDYNKRPDIDFVYNLVYDYNKKNLFRYINNQSNLDKISINLLNRQQTFFAIEYFKNKEILDIIIQKENNLKIFFVNEDSNNKDNDEIIIILPKRYKNNTNEFIKILYDSARKINSKDNVIEKDEEASKNYSINTNNTTFYTIDRTDSINIINETRNIKIKKITNLNCDQCHFIPAINLIYDDFPFIQSNCPNNHIEKKIDLINFFEKGYKFSQKYIKCKCKEYKNNSKLKLYYCHDCQIFFCEKCSSKHNKNHHIIFKELMNFYCAEHQKEFLSFCNNCCKNLCCDCFKIHNKEHEIYNLNQFKNNLNSIIDKGNNIIAYLENIKQILDNYKNLFIQKLNLLNNYYEMEITLFKEIIKQYSKNIYNYQIINNSFNITNFSFDDNNINSNDTFPEKTEKILNIIKKLRIKNIIKKLIL